MKINLYIAFSPFTWNNNNNNDDDNNDDDDNNIIIKTIYMYLIPTNFRDDTRNLIRYHITKQ